MIEHWQIRREGGQRGIVEIGPEGTRLRTTSNCKRLENASRGSTIKWLICDGQRPIP
jgi:hypothetical protein